MCRGKCRIDQQPVLAWAGLTRQSLKVICGTIICQARLRPLFPELFERGLKAATVCFAASLAAFPHSLATSRCSAFISCSFQGLGTMLSLIWTACKLLQLVRALSSLPTAWQEMTSLYYTKGCCSEILHAHKVLGTYTAHKKWGRFCAPA